MHDFIQLTGIYNSPCHVKPRAILAITSTREQTEAADRHPGSFLLLEYGHTLRVLETPEAVEAIRLKYYQDQPNMSLRQLCLS